MGLLDVFRRRPKPAVSDRPLKMSIVVAVYNTGTYLNPCLESLVGQTMPAQDYEVILVDDGSDDPWTVARVDEVAAKHANVTAIHIRNSGWPGKPRNVGVDAARGEYVYFVDHDDWLAPDALEKLHAYAVEHDADVAIGKIQGHGRRVPRTLFAKDRPSVTIETAPLMESMTPHKAFRRAFLLEHGIRFPEGRRRLEDHVYVVEAYLRARSVAVLSSTTCYHHIARGDAANAGFATLDPRGYYGNLREAIAVAERLTEPGSERRLICLRRWYGVEMLGRVGGGGFGRTWSEDYRHAMYATIRELALEKFTDPRITEGLSTQQRIRSHLLLAGDEKGLVERARWEGALALDLTLTDVEWADGRLRLGTHEVLRDEHGEPVLTVAGGGALRVGGPGDVPEELRRTTGERPRLQLLVRRRGTKNDRILPMRASALPTERSAPVEHDAVVELDPTACPKAPLDAATWDLFVRIRHWESGLVVARRLGAQRTEGAPRSFAPERRGEPALRVEPYWTEQDNLSLKIST